VKLVRGPTSFRQTGAAYFREKRQNFDGKQQFQVFPSNPCKICSACFFGMRLEFDGKQPSTRFPSNSRKICAAGYLFFFIKWSRDATFSFKTDTKFDGKLEIALFPSNSRHLSIAWLQEMSEKFDGKPHPPCFPSKSYVCLRWPSVQMG